MTQKAPRLRPVQVVDTRPVSLWFCNESYSCNSRGAVDGYCNNEISNLRMEDVWLDK